MSTHGTPRLEQALQDLKALPGLYADLSRCLTERPPVDDTGGGGGKPGSKPPLRLEVVHLTDGRRKPGWDGADPRVEDVTERFGVAAVLESWTRVLSEEYPDVVELAEQASVETEAAALVNHWAWIADQQWADELAEDVASLVGQIKAALYVRREPHYRCPQCNDRAQLVAGGFLTCPSGHEQSVRDLEAQYRRRPPATTMALAEEFGISTERIRQWAARKRIKPVRQEGRAALYLPWDVFCLVNPDIAAALDDRDQKESA